MSVGTFPEGAAPPRNKKPLERQDPYRRLPCDFGMNADVVIGKIRMERFAAVGRHMEGETAVAGATGQTDRVARGPGVALDEREGGWPRFSWLFGWDGEVISLQMALQALRFVERRALFGVMMRVVEGDAVERHCWRWSTGSR